MSQRQTCGAGKSPNPSDSGMPSARRVGGTRDGGYRMLRRMMTAIVLAGALVAGGAVAASANPAAPGVTADPASIEVDGEATVTATGLGGLETAYFGLDATPGGEFVLESGERATTAEVSVSDGTATVVFTATQPGTFTVAVGNGETPLAQVEVTVEAAQSPSPTPAPTVTVTVTPEPTGTPSPSATGAPVEPAGFPGWVLWLIIGLGILVVAAVVVIIVLARRGSRGRGDGPPAA